VLDRNAGSGAWRDVILTVSETGRQVSAGRVRGVGLDVDQVPDVVVDPDSAWPLSDAALLAPGRGRDSPE